MTNPRVAFVGAGNIANFHAPAFRAAGFDIAAVCARQGSVRAREFALAQRIPRVFESAEELADARDAWDAVLIAVNPEATLGILKAFLKLRVPILVEKPVALRSSELADLRLGTHNTLVAYNRRFYRSTSALRAEARKGGQFLAQMMLPDLIAPPVSDPLDQTYLRTFFANSVHGIDLLRFVFGDLELLHNSRSHDGFGRVTGFAATLLAKESRAAIQLLANWASPTNFSLSIHRAGRRVEMTPFESGAVYEGMRVVEPTEQEPIRRYIPILIERVPVPEEDIKFKPGFVAQARALGALVEKRDSWPAATLDDAYHALKMAEDLLGRSFGE